MSIITTTMIIIIKITIIMIIVIIGYNSDNNVPKTKTCWV